MKTFLPILATFISIVLPNAVKANIFGLDTRQQWGELSSTPNPSYGVGVLRRPDGERCTASYIGKNMILTAAHCVMKYGKNQLQKGDYVYEHNQTSDGSHQELRTITRFHYVELIQLEDGGLEKSGHHWAILELNKAIRTPKQFFRNNYPGDKQYDEHHESNHNLSIAGFSPEFNGKTKALTFSNANCQIQEHLLNSYIALHDCDAGPRDSGSPLYKCDVNKNGSWNQCNIYAIHIGAYSREGLRFIRYSRENANIAVTVKSFRKAFYYLTIGGRRPYMLKTINND